MNVDTAVPKEEVSPLLCDNVSKGRGVNNSVRLHKTSCSAAHHEYIIKNTVIDVLLSLISCGICW